MFTAWRKNEKGGPHSLCSSLLQLSYLVTWDWLLFAVVDQARGYITHWSESLARHTLKGKRSFSHFRVQARALILSSPTALTQASSFVEDPDSVRKPRFPPCRWLPSEHPVPHLPISFPSAQGDLLRPLHLRQCLDNLHP